MRISIVLIGIILATIVFSNTLAVVKDDIIELYDISVPLIPTRISVLSVKNVLKIDSRGTTLFVLCNKSFSAYYSNQSLRTVDLAENAVDFTILEDGSIFVLGKNNLYLYDSNLSFRSSHTFAHTISSLFSYKNSLVTLSSQGKVVAYTKNLSKLWEISGPEPFVGIQVSGDFLYAWSKSRFYTMKFNENVPILESTVRLSQDVRWVEKIRNNLVLLDSKGTLWLVRQNDFQVLDKLDVKAKSFSFYNDYIYVTLHDGTIKAVNVLFTSFKSLLTFGNSVKFTAIVQPSSLTQSSQASVKTSEAVPQEQSSAQVSKKFIELRSIFDLPLEIVSSPAFKNGVIYALSMTGELLIIDEQKSRTETKKIGFILTCDPVILPTNQVVFGSWDKNVYMLSEKVTQIKIDGAVSITCAVTPGGFCVTTDDGKLYLFNSLGQQLRYVILNGWLVCPPVVHENFGILTVDWLGIAKLIDFEGKEQWSSILRSAKRAKTALSDSFAFVALDEQLYSLELISGKTAWTITNGSAFKQLITTRKELFALDENGNIFCFDFSGKEKWKTQFEKGLGLVATRSGYLILITLDELIVMNQTDGKPFYREKLPIQASGYPILSDTGYLIVPSRKALIVYKIDDTPDIGWPMYLRDASNSGLFSRKDM